MVLPSHERGRTSTIVNPYSRVAWTWLTLRIVFNNLGFEGHLGLLWYSKMSFTQAFEVLSPSELCNSVKTTL